MQKYLKDIELVDRLRKGDVAAFDDLFNKYANRLYGFSLRYLKSEQEAEGLVQEVFIKVWEKRNQLKKEHSFSSYLFKIAYNTILKHFRKISYHRKYLDEEVALNYSSDETANTVEYSFMLDEIEKLIAKLPEKRKQIFIMSRKEGMSSKEIAEELNISPGTVDNNISEVLKFLRNNLKSDLLASLFIALFL